MKDHHPDTFLVCYVEEAVIKFDLPLADLVSIGRKTSQLLNENCAYFDSGFN